MAALALLESDDATLDSLIGRWYIPGREFRYVRRNALIVLGNTADGADPAVVEALTRALADPDPIVRSHAVWAANRLGRSDLLDPVRADRDPLVMAELSLIAEVGP
jgi:epoxyqueuosine reductase